MLATIKRAPFESIHTHTHTFSFLFFFCSQQQQLTVPSKVSLVLSYTDCQRWSIYLQALYILLLIELKNPFETLILYLLLTTRT